MRDMRVTKLYIPDGSAPAKGPWFSGLVGCSLKSLRISCSVIAALVIRAAAISGIRVLTWRAADRNPAGVVR